MTKKNIILVGMPGAGKSTVGVVLAKSAGLQFVDTDLLIQQHSGERLQEIINSKGIEHFLSIEESVVSALNCSGCVIATGGSVVLSDKAMTHLSKNGIVVFLDLPLTEIKVRLDNITTRGIAMERGDSIEKVYNARLPLYKKYADITVTSYNGSIEKTVEEILKSI